MVNIDLPRFVKYPIGNRFGSLTVIERVSGGFSKFVCRCDCGNYVIVTRVQLARGQVFSCEDCRVKMNPDRTCETCARMDSTEKRDLLHYCNILKGWAPANYSCKQWLGSKTEHPCNLCAFSGGLHLSPTGENSWHCTHKRAKYSVDSIYGGDTCPFYEEETR